MIIVKFDLEIKGEIRLYEVRAYRNRSSTYETINFNNGKGSRALAPGFYDISVLMWGSTGSGVILRIDTGDDEYEISGAIDKGNSDVVTGQVIVGPLDAFGVAP